MRIYHIVSLAFILIIVSGIIIPVTAKNINVDGDPSDWFQPVGIPGNSQLYTSGEYVWVDAGNDTRNDFVSINIDGSSTDWINDPYKYFHVIDSSDGLAGFNYAGANLTGLYAAWDNSYLYIAIETNNSASWDVAYGIGIDVDSLASGYNDTYNTLDSWNRNITFHGHAVDYEVYFYWTGSSGSITSDGFNTWSGNAWSDNSFSASGGSYAYIGDSTTGLQFLELRIPWSSLGGGPRPVNITAWIAGKSEGDSAVDTVPWDPSVEDQTANPDNEWIDGDDIGNMSLFTITLQYSTNDTLVDLTELHITSNSTHMFLLVRFSSLYYVGHDNAPGIMITVDTDNVTGRGEVWFGYNSDTQVSGDGVADWERQILIDLSNPSVTDGALIYGDGKAVWEGGSPLDVIEVSGSQWIDVSTNKSVFTVSIKNNTVEAAIAWSDLGITNPSGITIHVEAAVVRVDSMGNAWDPDGGSGSDVLDCMTTTGPNTWDEVQDGHIDYYSTIPFNNTPEPVPEPWITWIIVAAVSITWLTLVLRRRLAG